MAYASMNPIRLADAHLMCTAEFLITPGEGLGWLTALPHALHHTASDAAETAVSLVIIHCAEGLRTGLVLRLRMQDEHASAAECAACRSECLPGWTQRLEALELRPVQPLADEGVYALLPREGLTFLRRARGADGAPVRRPDMGRLTFPMLEELLTAHPGSGLCVTCLPRDGDMGFTVAHWGLGGSRNRLLNALHLPLADCPEAQGPLSGFHFLYDPWELLRRIAGATHDPALTATTAGELEMLLGTHSPAPHTAAAAPLPSGSAREMAQGLLGSIPSLQEQLKQSTRQLRDHLQQQVRQASADGLSEVQHRMSQAVGQLAAVPGMQQKSIEGVMERTSRIIRSITPHQAAEEARAAGLAGPIDALTLMKMGFSNEDELLAAGLDDDLLDLLRATVHLRQQCPETCSEDVNCMPYAFMIGYLYEALLKHCYLPLFHATDGYRRAHHLADYTRVNADHCQRLAAFPGYRDRFMTRLTPRDWAAWMTLCNMLRALRNRQHSDQAAGFICRREFIAAYEFFFFPGASVKAEMLALPAFQTGFPAWAKEFKPDLPDEWGMTPDEQRRAVRQHVSARVAAFDPSLLQLLLACRRIAETAAD
ncbi:MAG: hypothetical protein IKK57_10215 [Clostridia bacterium]|nr:hypothetical protein [Clostridia bacterium]